MAERRKNCNVLSARRRDSARSETAKNYLFPIVRAKKRNRSGNSLYLIPAFKRSTGMRSGYFPSVRISVKYLLSKIISSRISCQLHFLRKMILNSKKFIIGPMTGVVMPKDSVCEKRQPSFVRVPSKVIKAVPLSLLNTKRK